MKNVKQQPEVNEPTSKKLNQRHEIFIKEMIEHGNLKLAYMKSHAGTKAADESIRAAASRLYNQPEVYVRINEARERLQKETENDLTSCLKQLLDNNKGTRELLAAIISGEAKFEKVYKSGGKIKRVKLQASSTDVLRALELSYRITKDIPGPKQIVENLLTAGPNHEELK
jgi:protein involved in ribonucleotide reduction